MMHEDEIKPFSEQVMYEVRVLPSLQPVCIDKLG